MGNATSAGGEDELQGQNLVSEGWAWHNWYSQPGHDHLQHAQEDGGVAAGEAVALIKCTVLTSALFLLLLLPRRELARVCSHV